MAVHLGGPWSFWEGVRSLVGLLLELGGAVGESHIEFFGSLDDGLSVSGSG